jgi:uncharacterized membrane protein
MPVRPWSLSRARREALRTNLWAVPVAMLLLVVLLFVITYWIDLRAASGAIALPQWVNSGSPDASRQILIAIAAAVITVTGLVFSITILVLQLASQQFGPRMLRNFIRDFGTQTSLGAFVATFVYSTLTLVSVSNSSPSAAFVPHLSGTVAVVLMLVDLCVLIYFIDHVAHLIQLPTVVSSIAWDFRQTLANVNSDAARMQIRLTSDQLDVHAVADRIRELGAPVPAQASGFLQAVGHHRLVEIATGSNAVIRLLHRPGHFVVAGQPLAYVEPRTAAVRVSAALARTHIVGTSRTLTQDPGFAIDQLVEVAIRALSPAVNDTFTALNCIDWLGDCLCRACAAPVLTGAYCDAGGDIRLIEPAITQERLVKGATDKIRQAGRGMPAVLIRQLDNLNKVMAVVERAALRDAVLNHAELIMRSAEESVGDESDRADVRAAYDALLDASALIWQA